MATRDIWCAPVKDFEAIFSDPQVEAAEIVTTVEQPNIGPLKLIRAPITLSDTPATIRRPSPASVNTTKKYCVNLAMMIPRSSNWKKKEFYSEQRFGPF